MEFPAIPENERERIENLCSKNILETPAEEGFDRITRLAAKFFKAPISLVSLIDENRQWFKSKYGIEVSETDRNISFCAHAVFQAKPIVVPNALKDQRFHDNPLVTDGLKIRFYAGCPIRSSEGYILGTLCIIDVKPRAFSEQDLAHLRDFAGLVENQLLTYEKSYDSYKQSLELTHAVQRLKKHITYSPLGVIEWDMNFRVKSWSSRAKDIFGWDPADVIGKNPKDWNFIHELDLVNVREKIQEVVNLETLSNVSNNRNFTKDGRQVYCAWYNTIIVDNKGNPETVLSLVFDDTARVEAEHALQRSNEELENKVLNRTLEIQQQRTILDTVLDTIDVGIIACDAVGRLTLFNKATQLFHHLPRADIDPDQWSQHYKLLAPDGVTPLKMEEIPLYRALRGEIVQRQEFVIENALGQKRILLGSGQLLTSKQGEQLGAVVAMHDITEQKDYQNRLETNEKLLRSITDNIPALVSYIDHNQRYQYCNNQYQVVHGTCPKQLIGFTMEDFLGRENYGILRPYILKALSGEQVIFDSGAIINGEKRYAECRFIPNINEEGNVAGFYNIVWDVTETKFRELEYKEKATIDQMTGALNKEHITNLLKQEIILHKEYKEKLAIMFMDIDYFKSINDTFGHDVGDQMIKLFVKRMRNSVRDTDYIGRIGGDEFLIILTSIKSTEDVEKIAIKLLANISQPCYIASQLVPLTTSIGIACMDVDSQLEISDLLQEADTALYKAKAAGRAGYVISNTRLGNY